MPRCCETPDTRGFYEPRMVTMQLSILTELKLHTSEATLLDQGLNTPKNHDLDRSLRTALAWCYVTRNP